MAIDIDSHVFFGCSKRAIAELSKLTDSAGFQPYGLAVGELKSFGHSLAELESYSGRGDRSRHACFD